MGDLPLKRFSPNRSFSVGEINYAEPINIKKYPDRIAKPTK